MSDNLKWYAERAADLNRYMSENPPNLTGVLAILTELSIDGGKRGLDEMTNGDEFKNE